MTKPKRDREIRQLTADALIGLAQDLEKRAKAYREQAKHTRSGELRIDYHDMPADAHPRYAQVGQRAIDMLPGAYELSLTFETAREQLITAIDALVGTVRQREV